MIHTYSLIHDDLPCMDNDDLRRGKPTCHKVYGEATALLAGDGLLTRAFELVANAPGILPLRKCYAVAILAEAAGAPGMIGGQQMDLASEGKEITYETMVAIHEKKTCALLIAACRLGALSAGQRGSEAEEAMITYGMGIGRAFQLIDDLLDVTSTKEVLGKDIGSDQKNKKSTYLTFMPMETAEGLAKAITDKAKEAVEPYDKDGVLAALADYLTERKN
jgi:geranylgeranyl diphosphate synthase type II